LQNVIERAVILSSGPTLKVPVAELQPRTMTVPASEDASSRSTRRRPVRSILAEVDRDEIIQALKEADGRVGGPSGAAFRLGLKRICSARPSLGCAVADVKLTATPSKVSSG